MVLSTLALVLTLPVAGTVQEREDPGEREPPAALDLDYRVENPLDLLAPARRFHDRWRRIRGTLGTRYHLYPAQKAGGREDWPPRIFAGGWNYSLWRDPVTGWPVS